MFSKLGVKKMKAGVFVTFPLACQHARLPVRETRYAKFIGAEVYATAGADEKHEFLRSLGVAWTEL